MPEHFRPPFVVVIRWLVTMSVVAAIIYNMPRKQPAEDSSQVWGPSALHLGQLYAAIDDVNVRQTMLYDDMMQRAEEAGI